jgi:hypothetical protein
MGSTLSLNLQIAFYALIWVGTLNEKSKDEIKKIISAAEQKYQTDQSYKSLIDNLVESNEEFNKLLGDIGAQSQSLLKGLM